MCTADPTMTSGSTREAQGEHRRGTAGQGTLRQHILDREAARHHGQGESGHERGHNGNDAEKTCGCGRGDSHKFNRQVLGGRMSSGLSSGPCGCRLGCRLGCIMGCGMGCVWGGRLSSGLLSGLCHGLSYGLYYGLCSGLCSGRSSVVWAVV